MEEIVVLVERPQIQELGSKRKEEKLSETVLEESSELDTKNAELQNQIIQNWAEEVEDTLETTSSSDLIIKEQEDEVDEATLLLEGKL